MSKKAQMNVTEIRLLNKLYINREIANQRFKEAAERIMEKYGQHPQELFDLQSGEILTGHWEKLNQASDNNKLIN